MDQKTFHLVSLGCAKNTVDSESMAQLLAQSGYRAVENPAWAGVLIVNTCGFIGPAKAESLQVLGELAAKKRKGQTLIAAGCLTQRYGAEVLRQVPGIDGLLGTRRWMDIVDVVQTLRNGPHPEPLYHLPEAATVGRDEHGASARGCAGRQRLSEDCRRMPPPVRLLRHPVDQRHRRQPAYAGHTGRSAPASGPGCAGNRADRPGYYRLRPRPGAERRPGAVIRSSWLRQRR